MSRPLPLLERRPHAISLDHLSYSAIRTYQTCPRQFDYRYVQRLPDESVSSSLLFGTSLHRAVEAHFMAIMEGVPPPDLHTLLCCFWDSWWAESKPIQFNKGEDLDTIGALAERMLKVFQASPFARPAGHLIGIEEIRRGSFSARCPDFVARLDLLIETDEALVVTDFKTSRSRWSIAKLLASAPQLFIYHELIRDLANGRPVHLKFAVLTKAKKPILTEHQVYVTPALLAHTRRIVEATWDAIQRGAFPPYPAPMHCPRCPHQQKCGAWSSSPRPETIPRPVAMCNGPISFPSRSSTMVVLERRAAWLFRAALSRCFVRPGMKPGQISLQIRLGPDGPRMHACAPEIAISYAPGGPAGKGVFTFIPKYLAEFEGRNADPVEISLLRPDMAGARWTEKGRSRELEIPLVEPGSIAAFPEMPKEFMPLPTNFLAALDKASTVAACEPTKYALNRVQLRGRAGSVLASDQRQLFQEGGFHFPFTEDLLISRSGLFGLAPFAESKIVGIGRTETHLAIRVGPWTFAFFIDKQGRFPDVVSIIPKSSQAATRLRLDADDVQKFLDSLARRLKGPNANEMVLTLDLMGTPCLRFEIEGRVSEVKLMNSEFTGKPLRMCLNLQQFLGALELRFLDFEIRDADKPILARDGERLYLSMPLPASGAILPRSDKVPAEEPMPNTALAPIEKPSTPTIVVPMGSMPIRAAGGFDVIGEAEGLREGLFKVAAHAGRILQFLREVCTQQKVTQIVRSSLLALTESAHGEKP